MLQRLAKDPTRGLGAGVGVGGRGFEAPALGPSLWFRFVASVLPCFWVARLPGLLSKAYNL